MFSICTSTFNTLNCRGFSIFNTRVLLQIPDVYFWLCGVWSLLCRLRVVEHDLPVLSLPFFPPVRCIAPALLLRGDTLYKLDKNLFDTSDGEQQEAQFCS